MQGDYVIRRENEIVFPRDLYVGGCIVEFVNFSDGTSSYDNGNSIIMRIINIGIKVENKHGVREEWIDVKPWNVRDGFNEFAILLGRHYRVVRMIEGSDLVETLFEIKPPAWTTVLDIVNRSSSSFKDIRDDMQSCSLVDDDS